MGFAGLQFDASSGLLDLTGLSASGRREFRNVLSSHDQQLAGLRYDLGARGFGPGADVDQRLSRLGTTMEVAAGLSAPLICVELGPLPTAPPRPRPQSQLTQQQAGLILVPEPAAPVPAAPAEPATPPDPAFVAQVNAALIELGRLADRYSVVLAFRSELASFASLEQALRQANCPWFGVDLDPVAVLRDEWELDEIFSRLGPLVRHVRGRDAAAGPNHRTKSVVVGQGSVPWEALLSNLDDAAYHGWLTVDPIDLADRPKAASTALSVFTRIRR